MVSSLFDRSDYPTLRETVYLNQASLGLIGNPAVDAMHDLLDRVVRHGNLHMSDEDEVAFLDGLRERAARLLAVEGSRIAIVSSASELLGQAPFLLSPPRGSKVIAVASDFPAITRPWLRLAGRGECLVEFVEDRPESDLTADLVARIDNRTSVVAVGWVQYATGTVIDVPRLRAATEEAGVRLVLDATQGAGAMSVRCGHLARRPGWCPAVTSGSAAMAEWRSGRSPPVSSSRPRRCRGGWALPLLSPSTPRGCRWPRMPAGSPSRR